MAYTAQYLALVRSIIDALPSKVSLFYDEQFDASLVLINTLDTMYKEIPALVEYTQDSHARKEDMNDFIVSQIIYYLLEEDVSIPDTVRAKIGTIAHALYINEKCKFRKLQCLDLRTFSKYDRLGLIPESVKEIPNILSTKVEPAISQVNLQAQPVTMVDLCLKQLAIWLGTQDLRMQQLWIQSILDYCNSSAGTAYLSYVALFQEIDKSLQSLLDSNFNDLFEVCQGNVGIALSLHDKMLNVEMPSEEFVNEQIPSVVEDAVDEPNTIPNEEQPSIGGASAVVEQYKEILESKEVEESTSASESTEKVCVHCGEPISEYEPFFTLTGTLTCKSCDPCDQVIYSCKSNVYHLHCLKSIINSSIAHAQLALDKQIRQSQQELQKMQKVYSRISLQS